MNCRRSVGMARRLTRKGIAVRNIQHLCFLIVVLIGGCATLRTGYRVREYDPEPPIIDLRDCRPMLLEPVDGLESPRRLPNPEDKVA